MYAQSQVVGAEYFSTLAFLGGGTIARQTVTKVGTASRSRVRVLVSRSVRLVTSKISRPRSELVQLELLSSFLN